MTMSNTDGLVFKALHVVAWAIFIGLCIEAGGLTIKFIFSIYRPELVQDIYPELDLNGMYRDSKPSFFEIYSFVLSISILKAYLFYLVTGLVRKLDLSRPFDIFVSRQISRISYYTLSIGLLGYIAGQSAKNLMHHGISTGSLDRYWADSRAFVLMGAVIYIIATIFRKGVDIQNENELTV